MKIMARQTETLEINMELCRDSRHIAQSVARRDRHLGHRRMDVGRNR